MQKIRMEPDRNKLQILIPKTKNRDFERIKDLLEKCELKFEVRKDGFVSTSNPRFEIGFFAPADIPLEVEGGMPLGICGLDMVRDARAKVMELVALGIGKASVVLAKRREDGIVFPEGVNGKRIGTALCNLASDFLEANGISANVLRRKGALEAMCRGTRSLDLIVDQMVSGDTLGTAVLEPIATIMESEYYLIANTSAYQQYKQDIKMLAAMVKSVVDANGKYYVLFNVLPDAQKGIEKLVSKGRIPCGKSPTVQNLKDLGYAYAILIDGWQRFETQYLLERYGASDIISVKAETFVKGRADRDWEKKTPEEFYGLVLDRIANPVAGSRVTALLGDRRMLISKLGEESLELFEEAKDEYGPFATQKEAEDVLYALFVAMGASGFGKSEVLGMLDEAQRLKVDRNRAEEFRKTMEDAIAQLENGGINRETAYNLVFEVCCILENEGVKFSDVRL